MSPGCAKCYAETVAARFSGPGKPYAGLVDGLGRWNGRLRLVDEHLEDPLRWRKPRRIFVDSMSDLFHENVPETYIMSVFTVMEHSPQHTFQILTKREKRMRDVTEWLGRKWAETSSPWPLPNVWLGVSVENQVLANMRIPVLLQTPAAVRFISAEPLLGPVDLNRGGWSWLQPLPPPPGNKRGHDRGLDWVIIGGESGQGARPFNLAWARQIITDCRAAGVAVFMKQLGKLPYEGTDPYASGPAAAGCRLYELDIDKGHGGDPVEWPDDLRVREFPELRGRA